MYSLDHKDIFDHLYCVEPVNVLNIESECWNMHFMYESS